MQPWCCGSGAPEKPDEEETGSRGCGQTREFAGTTGNTHPLSARLTAALEPGEVLCCALEAQAKL